MANQHNTEVLAELDQGTRGRFKGLSGAIAKKYRALSPLARALVFILAFATIGFIVRQINHAETEYGDILTSADQLVVKYDVQNAHGLVEDDFAKGMPSAMLLYGDGLMLCSDKNAAHMDMSMSPLLSLKQRRLTSDEIAALFAKVRSLGFDDLAARSLPKTSPPAYGETPSVSLITSNGEHRVVMYSNEKSDSFTAITNYLDSECKKATEDFNPDDVSVESIKLPSSADANTPPLPAIPGDTALNDNEVKSSHLTGNDAKKVKNLIGKGDKVYKTADGKKVKLRVVPKVPEYHMPKLYVKSSSGTVAADPAYKIRFLYVYGADEAVPTDTQTQGFFELAATLPGYYTNQLSGFGNLKSPSSLGASVVRGSKTAAAYMACPATENCTAATGQYMSSLASFKNLQSEFQVEGVSTVVMYNWTVEQCIGWGGPIAAGSQYTNSVGSYTHGFAAVVAPNCTSKSNPTNFNTIHKIGAHETGHSFGLGHTTDLTIMNDGTATLPTSGYSIPLNHDQAGLLYNNSPYFNGTAQAASDPLPISSGTTFISVTPNRLLETRPGLNTYDGQSNGIGRLSGGSVTTLKVGGRAGIPANALAVALNVTAVNPGATGYMVVYPCGTNPTTSSVNYNSGINVSNMVISKLDGSGNVCIYTNNPTDLVVDVNGAFPAISTASYTNITPSRFLETRPGFYTIDGISNGIGRLGAGSTTQMKVSGRIGIPSNASAVSLNVTVVGPSTDGYVTIYPCDVPVPATSSVNFKAGQNISNAVISKIGNGNVCIYTNTSTDLVIDGNGAFNNVTSFKSVAPARLLETRGGFTTIDGQYNSLGRRSAGQVTELQVAGRANVPSDALAVALNVTVINPDANGYATVFPCGISTPATSNANYVAGSTVSIAVLAKLGAGKVCVYTNNATDLVVDVNGAFTAADTQQSALAVIDVDGVTSPAPPPPPTCPTGYSGTYPNCIPPSCPTGYTGTYPNCVAPTCPAGTTGTYPNCVATTCPSGYSGTYPSCVLASRCSGITLYHDAGYGGGTQTLTIGSYDTSQLTVGNDALSSAKVPSGCQLTLYLNSGFSGATQVLKKDWIGGTSDPWNDLASSVKVEESPLITATTPITCPSNGVTVFKDANFAGSSKSVNKGNYDGRKLPLGSDQISSIRVAAGCKVTLYQNSAYTGGTKILTGDWSAAAGDPWNDITSSLQVADRAVAVVDTTQMLQNPGFEQGTTNGWAATLPSGGTTVWGVKSTSGQSQTGTYYLEANSTPYGASIYQHVSPTGGLTVGTTYRYTAWVRSPSCTTVSMYFTLWSLWSHTNSYIIGSADCTWRQLSTTFTVAATGDTTLSPTISLNTSGVNLDIDSASLVKVTYQE